MKNHWTYYLSEAGTIVKQGEQQMYLAEKINELKKNLDILKEEHKEKEQELHKTALKNWTWGEIDEAKAKGIITQLTEEEKLNMYPKAAFDKFGKKITEGCKLSVQNIKEPFLFRYFVHNLKHIFVDRINE